MAGEGVYRTLVRRGFMGRKAVKKKAAPSWYTFVGEATCPACQSTIRWYRTPKRKIVPLNEETFEPHWKACPNGPRVIFD